MAKFTRINDPCKMAQEKSESTNFLKQMLELMKRKDNEVPNDNEPKCIGMNDCCKVAEELSESTKTLKEILELMRKKDKEERKDNVIYKTFPVRRADHVNVYVRVSIGRIGDIDAVRQEFQCKLYMTLRWKESRLVGKDTSNVDNIDWDPRYYFINAVNIQEHEVSRTIEKGEPPQVIHRCSIIGTFKEVLEINKFPFDYQDLSLTLTSKCRTDEMTFVKDPDEDDNIRIDYFYPKQEWDPKPYVIAGKKEPKQKEGASSNRYPEYEIRTNVMRQYKFYVYNIFLVMGLITALTFGSFTVEADLPGDRIQISLTLLLTSVAFKYYAQQFVPTVSYFTLLDKYILSCMVFQFIITLHNIVGGLITDSKALVIFEWICFGIALSTFLSINLYFVCLSFKYINEAKKSEADHKAEYEELNPRKSTKTKELRKAGGDGKENVEGCQVLVNKSAHAKMEND